jgi:hypothetical protein
MKFRVFWDAPPCGHIVVDRHFRGVYYLHHQGNVTTWRYIPEDSKLHTHHRENLKTQRKKTRYMFMFQHQTWGQNITQSLLTNFWKCGKVQMLGKNINKSELHTHGNYEHTKFGECLLPCSSESLAFPCAI